MFDTLFSENKLKENIFLIELKDFHRSLEMIETEIDLPCYSLTLEELLDGLHINKESIYFIPNIKKISGSTIESWYCVSKINAISYQVMCMERGILGTISSEIRKYIVLSKSYDESRII